MRVPIVSGRPITQEEFGQKSSSFFRENIVKKCWASRGHADAAIQIFIDKTIINCPPLSPDSLESRGFIRRANVSVMKHYYSCSLIFVTVYSVAAGERHSASLILKSFSNKPELLNYDGDFFPRSFPHAFLWTGLPLHSLFSTLRYLPLQLP